MSMTTCSHPECGAPVWMLKHVKTGNPAPIDVEPVLGGNIVVDVRAGTYTIVPKEQRGGRHLHTSHFASCEHAKAFR